MQSTLPGAFRYQQVTSPDDTDGDGLPNAWETQWGLNPNSADGADGAAGDPDGDGVLNIDEKNAGSHPRGFVKRYFAEGVVNGWFDTRFALANPQAEPAHVLLEFLDLDGQTSQQILLLPARSRTTVRRARRHGASSGKNFATRIESDEVIVADRLMHWEATYYGSHAETAISEPSTTWYFAEGASSGPFDLFYLLQNPTEQVADVDIRFLRPNGAAPVTRTYHLTPRSRTTIYVDNDIAELRESEVSAQFTSTNGVPIIAERSMYFSSALPFMGGHGSAGVTAPAKEWFLAEGATGTFLHDVRADREPDRSARDRRGDVSAGQRRADRQDVYGGRPTAASTSTSTASTRDWRTRRWPAATSRTCRSSSSARCGGRASRRSGRKATTASA